MSRDADFERFAADATTGTILALRKMAGATFTESDRRAMVEGLDVIRVAMVQPVGTSAAPPRAGGGVVGGVRAGEDDGRDGSDAALGVGQAGHGGGGPVMSVEDDVRSLSARVAKLTTAVERSCTAQVESAEWCSQTQSDVATLMAEVRELGRRYDNMAVVLSRLVDMLRVRREARGTSAMPVCGGLWDDEIESMTAEGASLSEIAARIGCGVATVSRRRRQLGTDGAAYKRKWTDREDAVLREAVKLADSWAEVAEDLPGRTEAACCARAKRHGLRLRHKPPRAWTSEEDAFLREHWVSCDMETPEIARALGRTEHAVRTRASKLGIADSGRREWALAKSSARFWARGETR